MARARELLRGPRLLMMMALQVASSSRTCLVSQKKIRSRRGVPEGEASQVFQTVNQLERSCRTQRGGGAGIHPPRRRRRARSRRRVAVSRRAMVMLGGGKMMCLVGDRAGRNGGTGGGEKRKTARGRHSLLLRNAAPEPGAAVALHTTIVTNLRLDLPV